MKKVFIVLLIIVFRCNVYASSVVMDMDSGRVLYGSGENDIKLIASTTKIMTSLVVINNSNLDDIVTVDENILRSTGSGIYIEIGEKIKVRDLLYGLMLRSGNDAAIALSTYVGGSEEGFALMMNELALSIGMKNTTFINASGLENNLGVGNTSTAYDMALLMSYAMKNKVFREITGTKSKFVKTNKKTYEWHNKNKLLIDYKYTTGGKTGYTKKAYRTLVTSASKNGKNLCVVTLNEKDDFNKHKYLYETYFKKYNIYKIKSDKYDFDISSLLISKDEKVSFEIMETDDIINRFGILNIKVNHQKILSTNVYKKENFTFSRLINMFKVNLN